MSSVAESLNNDSEMVSCPTFPSFRLTSKTLYGLDTVVSTKESVTSFLLAGPASRTPLPERDKALPMIAKDGPTSSKSFARLSPNGSWEKTSAGYVQATLDGTLQEYSGTWPKAGTMLDGECFRQEKWERRIKETDSGLWATPQARDFRSGEAHRWGDERRSNNLNDQVAFFATPRASDANGAKVQPNKQGGLGLNQQVSGKLAPEFVEWLMNWPRGWSALEPMPRERFDEWLAPGWWVEEPADMSRLTDGVPNRTNRIKALGNGQVPMCAATAWLLLMQGDANDN